MSHNYDDGYSPDLFRIIMFVRLESPYHHTIMFPKNPVGALTEGAYINSLVPVGRRVLKYATNMGTANMEPIHVRLYRQSMDTKTLYRFLGLG